MLNPAGGQCLLLSVAQHRVSEHDALRAAAHTLPGGTQDPIPAGGGAVARRTTLALDVVIPVYNEEAALRRAVIDCTTT